MTRTVFPFRAFLYDPTRAGSLADAVSPPYDVITPALREELYARGPYNFCRVDLPLEEPPARYKAAAATLARWIEEGILYRDARPAVYRHRHDFRLPDGTRTSRGAFFAVRRLEAAGKGVLPHEKTLEAPKEDRLRITLATKMQISPVFCLYEDAGRRLGGLVGRVETATPAYDFTLEGERHRLWKITDGHAWETVTEVLSGSPLVIADGHHRFETAGNYLAEIAGLGLGLAENASARHVLMSFTAVDDAGLRVLPIHRAVSGLEGFDFARMRAELADWEFVRREVGDASALAVELAEFRAERHAFAFIPAPGSEAWIGSLRRAEWKAHALAEALPPEIVGLDVTVLHRRVFEGALGMTEASQREQKNLNYFKSAGEALAEVRDGRTELAVLVNPVTVAEVVATAKAGLKMPQKSSFFYPKVPSGLVIHPVGPEDTVGF